MTWEAHRWKAHHWEGTWMMRARPSNPYKGHFGIQETVSVINGCPPFGFHHTPWEQEDFAQGVELTKAGYQTSRNQPFTKGMPMKL